MKNEEKQKKLSGKEKEKILKEMHRRYEIISTAEHDNKERFKKNMKFAFNVDEGHWTSEDITERDSQGRPHLTANKMAKFVRQVVNAEKSLPNTDEVIAVDDKGDKYTAQAYNDIIEDIEYRSDAEYVYGIAGEHACGGGFGYFRINTKWDGFDQVLELLPCINPLLVSVDPRRKFAFVRECFPMDEFKSEFPDAEKGDFDGDFDETLWYEPDKIWVTEYFTKEPVKRWLVEYINSNTNETGLIKVDTEDEIKDSIPEGSIESRRKEIDDYKVMWYKATGKDIVDWREWMGCEIPIVEVPGHEIHLEGKTYKQSLIEDAKDMNRMYDYWLTAATEQVAMAPRAPYLVTKEMIKGHEGQWDNANKKLYPYLKFNNNPLGKPTREQAPGVDPGILQMLQIADANIKDVLGMYETSLGEQSNERSSKAITSRKAISDQGTFNFPYNFHRAKLEAKKIMIDLIPKVYDNERVIRLRNSDREVKINYTILKNGKEMIINDLSVGKYDIRVKQQMTPSRRQQIVDNFVSAMQYVPAHADLIFQEALRFMDIPGMEGLSEKMGQRTNQLAMQNQANGEIQ